MRVAASAGGLLLLAGAFVHTQDQRPTVRGSTAGVLIDVTVVDKDGRPVTDLTTDDFAIAEDGKSQTILSATLMQGGVPARLNAAPRATETTASTVSSAGANGAPAAA